MKVLVTWTLRPGAAKEAAGRFLAGQAAAPEGTTLLGRWHKTDGSGGYSLHETNDPAALYAGTLPWLDVLEFHNALVVEDAEAGPALAKVFGK
jgi:Protein of unknown function (DUF3303)